MDEISAVINSHQIITTKLENLHGDVSEMKSVLKELTTAINRLALVEERQAVTASSLDRAFKSIDVLAGRIALLEVAAPLNKQATDWGGRIVWMAMSALVGAVISKVVFFK